VGRRTSARPQLALATKGCSDCIAKAHGLRTPSSGSTSCAVVTRAHRGCASCGKEITMRKQQVQGAKNGMRGTGTFKRHSWLAVATALWRRWRGAGEVSSKARTPWDLGSAGRAYMRVHPNRQSRSPRGSGTGTQLSDQWHHGHMPGLANHERGRKGEAAGSLRTVGVEIPCTRCLSVYVNPVTRWPNQIDQLNAVFTASHPTEGMAPDRRRCGVLTREAPDVCLLQEHVLKNATTPCAAEHARHGRGGERGGQEKFASATGPPTPRASSCSK